MAQRPGQPERAVGRCWHVRGQVQGVGFRPFVYRIANACDLSGSVRNSPAGVTIEAWGDPAMLEVFDARLVRDAPALARIDHVASHSLADPVGDIAEVNGLTHATPHSRFRIEASAQDGRERGNVTIDAATCDDCLRELRDPGDRRYRHPLINCTNCGPRFTIIRDLPYDRQTTTMAEFAMCPQCAREYADAGDRRFHAQPVCCRHCGPQVRLFDAVSGEEVPGDPLRRAIELLLVGKVVAIKGLGGYHLAVDAASEPAVRALRERKRREHKPFALMVPDASVACDLANFSLRGLAALTSPARPIVLARRRDWRLAAMRGDAAHGPRVAPSVAMGSHRYGIMLPSTPMQHLLFDGRLQVLVMTSANASDEPLIKDDDAAQSLLYGLVDALLTHDRPIERAVDDSILIDDPGDADAGVDLTPAVTSHGVGFACPTHAATTNGLVATQRGNGALAAAGRAPTTSGRPMMVRRARGYVPSPMPIPVPVTSPGVCVGADLKGTVAVVRGTEAILSQHLGDLAHPLAHERFQATIRDLIRLFDLQPRWVACDLHPGYLSRRFARQWARERDLQLIEVQHHHAHLASLLAEHRHQDAIVGLVCDGVGYGADGAAWGGEVLIGDLRQFRRVGRIRPLHLPGGDAAARSTGRCGLSWMHDLLGPTRAADHPVASLVLADARERAAVLFMLERQLQCPPSSGLGRLFDAAAAVLGVCSFNHFEAMSGQALEAAASRASERPDGTGVVSIDGSPDGGGLMEIDHRPLLARLLEARAGDLTSDPSALAWFFHDALADGLAEAAVRAATSAGIATVGLSGGVFCNTLLTERVRRRLECRGFEVLMHAEVPANDGGIACGQAAIAACLLQRQAAG